MPTKRSSKASKRRAQYTASAAPTRTFVRGYGAASATNVATPTTMNTVRCPGSSARAPPVREPPRREAMAAAAVGRRRLVPASGHSPGVRTVLVATFLTTGKCTSRQPYPHGVPSWVWVPDLTIT